MAFRVFKEALVADRGLLLLKEVPNGSTWDIASTESLSTAVVLFAKDEFVVEFSWQVVR